MLGNELKHGSGQLGALGGKSCITVASIINDRETKYCIYLFIKQAVKTQRMREMEEKYNETQDKLSDGFITESK